MTKWTVVIEITDSKVPPALRGDIEEEISDAIGYELPPSLSFRIMEVINAPMVRNK